MPSAAASKLSNRSSVLLPNSILQDRYLIIRQLGRGGMGAVYEALDQRLDAIVALKETFSSDERLRRQFEQEARLLAHLHHPALPRVSDYFTEGDRAFLVMQFIAGVDLAEIIATQPGPFPRNQVIAWADQLLDALMYLHTRERQIIHRDIKPHNLKVTGNGQIALLDFGLARAETGEASGSSNSIFGYTRRYSPLEQIRDQGTSPQSDIYALGATLYHLLTGVKPQDALARAAAVADSKPDPLTPAHEIHRAVGPEISAILNRAMALSAEDRYPTASDFRGALRRVGRSEPPMFMTANNPCITETAGGVKFNQTVVRQSPPAAIDPFDSYSILKPGETAWLNPKPGRRTAAVMAVILMVVLISAGAFYGVGHWTAAKDSLRDFAKPAIVKAGNSAPVAHQSKAEKTRVGSSAVVSVPAPAAPKRKSEKPKHSARRSDSARSKSPNITPPAFSILP